MDNDTVGSSSKKAMDANDDVIAFKDEAMAFNDEYRYFELGECNSFCLCKDPKRIGFVFSRYKFVSKMLEGFDCVLEIGCEEALGTITVSKVVNHAVAVDFYAPHIESAKRRLSKLMPNVEFRTHDIVSGPVFHETSGLFDAAYCLDVFEHIDPAQSGIFFNNVISSLKSKGVFIIGAPSLESQIYASESARRGHINCMSGKDLKMLCKRYFDNVFMFGMNDEVVHTGFLPMAHYLFALCVGVKR